MENFREQNRILNCHKAFIKSSRLGNIICPIAKNGERMNFRLALALCFLATRCAFAATDDDANLINAAGRGDYYIFNMMLDRGANPDAIDSGRNTAILMAAYYQRRDMVRRLIGMGVNVDVKGKIGYSPVAAAAMHGDDQILGMLIKAGARLDVHDYSGDTPLLNAIRFQHDKNVGMLLEAGENVDIPGAFGMTPLMLAAQMGRLDYVVQLLAKGANVNLQGDDQATALYFAIYGHHDEIVKRLVEAGANLVLLVNGYTPLHWARVMGMQDVVPVMIQAGAVE